MSSRASAPYGRGSVFESRTTQAVRSEPVLQSREGRPLGRKRYFQGLLAVCLILLGLIPAARALDTSKLQPHGYVNDFAHALDSSSAYTLEQYCTSLDQATGVQIAIVLVDSLEDEPIEDVANRLYRQWGIGKKGKDEGPLLLLAIKNHKQRAEVGYGLEGTIPDIYAGQVLRGIRPILRQGNYGGALIAAVQQFGSRIAQEKGVSLQPMQGQAAPGASNQGSGGFLPVIIVIILVILVMGWMGRHGGGGGGFHAGMILGDMMGGRGGGGWGGGGFGGGGGGGGGFGGFGGGSSGGGGASDGW